MKIDFSKLDPKAIYFTMIQCIVPRPIAWILSDNGDSSHNLAPFSYFNGVCSRPPILFVSIGRKKGGEKKDTWRNIEERQDFVIHIPRYPEAEAVSASAAPLDFGKSEVEAGGHQLINEPDWPLPRLSDSPLALLCRHYKTVEVGEASQGLILGEIIAAHIDDDIKSGDPSVGDFTIDVSKLNPLSRLGEKDYGSVGGTKTVNF